MGCQWSHDGSILAVAGTMSVTGGTEKDSNVVQFYTPFGEHLRTLKVPGKQITGCAWEGGSLRISLSVDSFIYFANIRPDYKWAYFADVIVYVYNRADKEDTAVVFWNHKTGDKNYRHVKGLLSIAATGEHCVLATNYEETSGSISEDTFTLLLCNALGTPIDSKQVSTYKIHAVDA